MPDRAHLTRRRLAPAALLLLAACAPSVTVDTYVTEPGTELTCRALLADLPQVVAGAPRIPVVDDVAAAWGDPPVVLRCGVEQPVALTPTTRCDVVADVGWFTEDVADGRLFTTVGRELDVSVEVPDDYSPAADALVDLADTIARHVPEESPCV